MPLFFWHAKGCGATQRFVAWLLVALLVGGCAGQKTKPESRNPEALLEEATQALSGGLREKSLGLLETAARDNPTDARPWLQIAKVHFDNHNYPAAIAAGDEALKRDPASQEARSIVMVAALRVAVRSLAELRSAGGPEGEARSHAERLAKELRETLGEAVLVPAGQAAPGAAAVSPAARKPVPRTTRPAPAMAPAAVPAAAASAPPVRATAVPASPATPAVRTPPARASTGTGDPFGTLK